MSNALHLLPQWSTVPHSIGIEFDPHRLRVEIIEIQLNLKDVLLPVSLNLHVAEAQPGPFLFQSMSPINVEGLAGFVHEVSRTLQHREGRMPFIQMTDFRLKAQRTKQSPSADPEQHFLFEAQLRPPAIQFAGNTSMQGNSPRHCCPAGTV